MKNTLIAATLLLSSVSASALEIGVGVGVCGITGGYSPVCNGKYANHFFVKHELTPFKNKKIKTSFVYHHFSRLEDEDFDINVRGTGNIDYFGIDFSYKFD